MKGMINEAGVLHIERKRDNNCLSGSLIPARCPFDRTECGDWCPLFGEPYPHTERRNPFSALDLSTELTGKTALSLCHKTLIFDEFTDEREETNENI
jgi:hypothetical protein